MKTPSLLERITASKADMNRNMYQQTKAKETSSAARVSEKVTFFQKFAGQLLAGFIWIFNSIVKPLFFWLIPIAKWLLTKYILLWNKFVYKKDKYQIPVFSNIRAAGMIFCTFMFLLASPILIEGMFDWTLYLTTSKINEKLILFGSQEVNALAGDHNVEGCPDEEDYAQAGCPDTKTVYFRTRFSLFNEIWSLLYKHELYWPEYVGSAVPYTTSSCTADSYGVRLKLIMKDIEYYPTLLAVNCRPIQKK